MNRLAGSIHQWRDDSVGFRAYNLSHNHKSTTDEETGDALARLQKTIGRAA